MKWGMAQAEYGSEDHIRLMREGWEPLNVVTVHHTHQLSREVIISFLVFMKKQVENVDEGKSTKPSSGIIQG
jgi:hypothetical protein